jgi:hypothetical protein
MALRQSVAFLLLSRRECERIANVICATAAMPPFVLPINKEINQGNNELIKKAASMGIPEECRSLEVRILRIILRHVIRIRHVLRSRS